MRRFASLSYLFVAMFLLFSWVMSDANSALASTMRLGEHVVDRADVLSPEVELGLEQALTRLTRVGGCRLLVLTEEPPSDLDIDLGLDLDLAIVSQEALASWENSAGDENPRQIVLLVVGTKAEIAVSYGLNDDFSKEDAQRVLDLTVRPFLASGDFDSAVLAAVYAIVRRTDPGVDSSELMQKAFPQGTEDNRHRGFLGALSVFLLLILWSAGQVGSRRSRDYLQVWKAGRGPPSVGRSFSLAGNRAVRGAKEGFWGGGATGGW